MATPPDDKNVTITIPANVVMAGRLLWTLACAALFIFIWLYLFGGGEQWFHAPDTAWPQQE